jgi:signal peptidase I
MDPLIREGDVVLVKPIKKEDIMLGDILAFKQKDSQIITGHRLIKVTRSPDRVSYILQGDFSTSGADEIFYEDIIGKVVGLQRDDRVFAIDTLYERILKNIWNSFYLCGKAILIFLKWRSIWFRIGILINPSYFMKSPAQLVATTREKFNQKEEVDFNNQYLTAEFEDWEEAVVKRFMNRKGVSILDVGCGSGREAIQLAKLGFNVIGIDIAPEMVKAAHKNIEKLDLKIDFKVMAASEIEFPEASFDFCMFSLNVYSFIPSRALRIETLKRIKKSLKPNGLIFLSAYIIKRPLFSAHRLIGLLRKLRNFIMPLFLSSEAGDVWIRGVSPLSRVDKFCFCHYFYSEKEIINEIIGSGLKPMESKIDNIFMAIN